MDSIVAAGCVSSTTPSTTEETFVSSNGISAKDRNIPALTTRTVTSTDRTISPNTTHSRNHRLPSRPPLPQDEDERTRRMTTLRERQWIYLGPILATPLAHISVTLYRDAKTKQQKQFLLGVGIIGSTIVTLGMRLSLMYHAGYPGGRGEIPSDRYRTITTVEERERVEAPTWRYIIRQAFRGFG